MAIQQVNVYSFNITLKSKHKLGDHVPTKVLAIGVTAAAAQQVLQQQFGGDLGTVTGGVQTNSQPAFTTLA